MHRSATGRLLLTLVILVGLVPASRADILLSELCDPRLDYTTDRFIEIYNSGAGAVDLTGWSVVAVGNGTDIFVWNLSGSIAAGDALVVGDANTVDVFPVDFADDAWSSSNGLWNGKVGDGAKLLDAQDAVVDYVVVDATRFENKDYVRNPGVTAPNTAFDPGEWTATAVDRPSQGTPGVHSADPPLPTPVITGVTLDPAAPLPGQDIAVEATVTDGQASIVSVALAWGTAADSLMHQIPMSLLSGDLFHTDTPIPAQPGGTSIFYRVEALNDVPAGSESPVLSYQIPIPLEVRSIQGEFAASPFVGRTVLVSGTIGALYGGWTTLQDAFGEWNGLWLETPSVAAGDSVSVTGTVSESATGFAGTTVLVGTAVVSSHGSGSLPVAVATSSLEANSERFEGVLLSIQGVMCTDTGLPAAWSADDGSGPLEVGNLVGTAVPTPGSVYDLTGYLRELGGVYRLEPRGSGDLQWVADPTPPALASVTAQSDTIVVVTFTETVEKFSAETVAHYTIPGLSVVVAARDPLAPSRVVLTVTDMVEGSYVLTVSDVEDLYGNVLVEDALGFDYADTGAPPGYYDPAAGLVGEALRAALHDIIDGHTAHSYDFAWTAYWTTDDKPNGKVWDIYSDVPGGVPPYEYDFGVDEGGIGGAEGLGYTREHSWPKSWFGGEVSPMYTDLFALYPCDAHVNGNRGVYPYGEVDNPEWVSLNGSKRGPSSYPGYTGTVFEPIDAYKGDLARTYFYMATRYYGEDAAWPGSPMTDGADLLPWAADMMLEWHHADPVSQKEIDRNNTVYGFQGNRNPYIDHPSFADQIFAEVTDAPSAARARLVLHANVPNPFNPMTLISFELPARREVDLRVYDVSGRLVCTLLAGDALDAGGQSVAWRGMDDSGHPVAAGVYFCRLQAGGETATGKMMLVK